MKTLLLLLAFLLISQNCWGEEDYEINILNDLLKQKQFHENRVDELRQQLYKEKITEKSQADMIVMGGGFSYTKDNIWPFLMDENSIWVTKFFMRKKDGYWAYPQSFYGILFEVKGQNAVWITKDIYSTLPEKVKKLFTKFGEEKSP